MKITIEVNTDNQLEIQKAIVYLQNLLPRQPVMHQTQQYSQQQPVEESPQPSIGVNMVNNQRQSADDLLKEAEDDDEAKIVHNDF
ncbi:hypothetical protein COV16_04745 [Candidatus Woesearchaeota archaeon CG10_big_fil_rev_8_21_14_0_10_34_8]|nr:MAG: hypothetical protein COV16_04745 [Candidatus Woesearchaeota archaeon CG10_big_fil_rev_8_21_14_0_10_34_8]